MIDVSDVLLPSLVVPPVECDEVPFSIDSDTGNTPGGQYLFHNVRARGDPSRSCSALGAQADCHSARVDKLNKTHTHEGKSQREREREINEFMSV